LRAGEREKAEEQYRQALTLAIALKVPESIDARYLMAATYSGLGDVASGQAQTAGTAQQRSKFWDQARSWYEQSLAEWAKVPNPSHTAPNEFKVDVPSEVERRLARCRMDMSHTKPSADVQ